MDIACQAAAQNLAAIFFLPDTFKNPAQQPACPVQWSIPYPDGLERRKGGRGGV